MAEQLPLLPKSRSSVQRYDRQAIQATTLNLTSRFEALKGIYETSEADYREVEPAHVECDTSTLLNSENSPYGCEEDVETLGQKLWGYQLGDFEDFQSLVLRHLPEPLQDRASGFFRWRDPDHVLQQLAEYGVYRRRRDHHQAHATFQDC